LYYKVNLPGALVKDQIPLAGGGSAVLFCPEGIRVAQRVSRLVPADEPIASYTSSGFRPGTAPRAWGVCRKETIVKKRIRLRGMGGELEGKSWESSSLLRVGRLESFEIVIDDPSVSRRHAEIRCTDVGWHVCDLGSTNGTFLNGARLTRGERRLRARDLVQFGKTTFLVDRLDEVDERPKRATDQVVVEACTQSSWEDAIQGIAYDRHSLPRQAEQLLTLLRASHHLGHLESEDELLHSILNDAVQALDAQRGAIVLADGPDGPLQLRALASGRGHPGSRTTFSQSLAQRCFARGESILCSSVGDDPELATAHSIHEGAMASVLCVLLRTPRKRVGVLHLDRSHWQKAFNEDDLHLADALAASVSAGIESTQLLRKQQELFLNTITVLAQAIEMRDLYTGGHTSRVTTYAELLGKQLALAPEELRLIRIGTPLHDIGKIGIDDAILRKADQLTADEYAIMQTHTIKGAAIVATVPELVPAIPIIRSHHEQWDGHGYPDGLVGEAIPRLARIVAVADAFDAMTSDRPYRRARGHAEALRELQQQSERQFDPVCVAAFVAIRERVLEEMSSSFPASAPDGNSSFDSTIVTQPTLSAGGERALIPGLPQA
jgi:HD-GYP domain-containing protein (c-di-GMP phosphodiesterase class II)